MGTVPRTWYGITVPFRAMHVEKELKMVRREENGVVNVDELKPVQCGCGGEAIVAGIDGKYFCCCTKCKTSTFPQDTEKEAVDVWKRAMWGSH